MAAPASRAAGSERLPPAGWALGLEEEASNGSALDERIRSGFSVAAARRFMEALDVERDAVARMLGVSTRTLARRLDAGQLKPAESDRLYRYAHLFERAASVLGGSRKRGRGSKRRSGASASACPFLLRRRKQGPARSATCSAASSMAFWLEEAPSALWHRLRRGGW